MPQLSSAAFAALAILVLTILVISQQVRISRIHRDAKKKEELFQIVTENAADMIALVDVNGQQLAPGEYQVLWNGTGPNVEVSIMQGKKEVAKTSARVVELDKASDYDAAVVEHASGKASVSQVRFAGKKYALAIGATDKAEMNASSTK